MIRVQAATTSALAGSVAQAFWSAVGVNASAGETIVLARARITAKRSKAASPRLKTRHRMPRSPRRRTPARTSADRRLPRARQAACGLLSMRHRRSRRYPTAAGWSATREGNFGAWAIRTCWTGPEKPSIDWSVWRLKRFEPRLRNRPASTIRGIADVRQPHGVIAAR